MKKNYLKTTLLLFTLISFNSKAQEFKKHGFGIKAGANSSKLHTLDNYPQPFEKDSDMKIGFYAGIYGEISLNENKDFALQPEVYYSQQGYKKQFTSSGQTNEVDYTLPMVTVPVLLKYYIWDQFSVVLGPQFSFFGEHEWEFDNDRDVANSDITSRVLMDSDFSIASGFSFNTRSGLSLDFRYNHGAKSIYKKEKDITTRNLQVGLSYKF